MIFVGECVCVCVWYLVKRRLQAVLYISDHKLSPRHSRRTGLHLVSDWQSEWVQVCWLSSTRLFVDVTALMWMMIPGPMCHRLFVNLFEGLHMAVHALYTSGNIHKMLEGCPAPVIRQPCMCDAFAVLLLLTKQSIVAGVQTL